MELKNCLKRLQGLLLQMVTTIKMWVEIETDSFSSFMIYQFVYKEPFGSNVSFLMCLLGKECHADIWRSMLIIIIETL